jgi:hypothetical protein
VLTYWVTGSHRVTLKGVQEKHFGKRNVPATTKIHNFARKLEKTCSPLDERVEYRRQVPAATTEEVCVPDWSGVPENLCADCPTNLVTRIHVQEQLRKQSFGNTE